MKKSRIILPAVALLTISTVAAASSTVAWFAASRDVTIDATQIAVYNPESNLNVTLADVAGTGTTTANAVGQTHAKITFPDYMRDGSVDAKDGKVYKQDVVSKEFKESTWTEDKYSDGKTSVYRATSWTMKFEMAAVSNDDYAIFFNAENLKNLKANDGTTENGKISESFRLAFVVGGEVALVVAPFGTHGKLTYVQAVDINKTASTGEYDKVLNNSATKQATELASADQDTVKIAANGYIGTIASKGALNVTCYAWFEGTDEACVLPPTGEINTVISGTINFYASRLLKA